MDDRKINGKYNESQSDLLDLGNRLVNANSRWPWPTRHILSIKIIANPTTLASITLWASFLDHKFITAAAIENMAIV